MGFIISLLSNIFTIPKPAMKIIVTKYKTYSSVNESIRLISGINVHNNNSSSLENTFSLKSCDVKTFSQIFENNKDEANPARSRAGTP